MSENPPKAQDDGENGMNTNRFNSDVDAAFDPEKRQAQKDWDAYLAGSDTQDAKGKVHDAATGQFKALNPDAHYESSLGETNQYEGKSLSELAHMILEARGGGDKTAAQDTEDVFFQKFTEYADAKGLSKSEADTMLERYTNMMYNGETTGVGKKIEVQQEGSASTPDADGTLKVSRDGAPDVTSASKGDMADDAESSESDSDSSEAEQSTQQEDDQSENSAEAASSEDDKREDSQHENSDAKDKELSADPKEALKTLAEVDVEGITSVDEAEEMVKQFEQTLKAIQEAQAAGSVDKETPEVADSPEGATEPTEDTEVVEDAERLSTDELRAKLRALAEEGSDEDIRDKLRTLAAEGEAFVAAAEQAEAEVGHEDAVAAEAARAEKIAAADAALQETELGVMNTLRAKLYEYAARKADVDTKGGDQEAGWKIWQRGRQKRAIALRKAEEALFVAHAEYVKKLQEKREEAGVYSNLSEEAKAVVIENDKTHDNYLLDVRMQNATRTTRLERMKRPNFAKGVAAVTKLMSGGNKKEWLLFGGAGALTGGTVAALSGVVGFPITVGAGIGLRKLVRDGVERNVLDEQLKAREDAVVSDDGFDAYRLRMAGIRAETQYQKIVDEARAAGREDLIKAREVAKGKVKKFTIGYAAAGVAVHGVQLGGKLVEHFSGGSEDTAIATSGGHGPGYNFSDGAEYGDTPAPEVPSVSHGFEFPSGSDVITPGEGMYHQLGDMGFSPAEAQQLFNNHDMMMQLKGVNAVYPDSSASIGGWGINMPANGRWSPEAMSIIKNTAINMGIRS